jgi:ABC-type transporter Mla MlaB component
MSKKTRRSPIGFDPLAWMKGGSSAANAASSAEPARPPVVTKARPAEEAVKVAAPVAKAAPVAESKPEPVVQPATEKIVALANACKLTEVGKLYGELKQALAGPRRVVLDATDVRGMDTAAMQLLNAFIREAQARRIAVEWREAKGALTRDAKTLGLTGRLQLPA